MTGRALGALALVLVPLAARATTSWGPETNLSLTATDSETGLNHRSIARTQDGITHVVWAERDTPNATYRIRTRRFDGIAWTASELVVDYLPEWPGDAGDDIGAKYPGIACAVDGTLHLFWHDYRIAGIANVEIFTKALPPGAAWDPDPSADIRLTTTSHPEALGDNGYVPVPVAAPDGAIHALWYDFRWDGSHAEIVAKSAAFGGSWDLAPGDAADTRVTSDPAHSELVDAAADAQGHVHAVWRSVDGGARIYYARRDASAGTWSAPIPVDLSGAVAGAPCVAAALDGGVHVVWPDSREGGRALWSRVRETSGAWSAEQRLTLPAQGADEPAIDSAEDGTLHLVWQDGRVSLLNREVFHRERAPGVGWDVSGASDLRISNASGASGRPTVLARAGTVVVTWRDERDGNREIYVRRRADSASGIAATTRTESALHVSPNPARGPVRILRVSDRGPLLVHDAAGRLVRRLEGGAELVWDARDARGRRVPAGVYFLRDAQDDARARVTVLR